MTNPDYEDCCHPSTKVEQDGICIFEFEHFIGVDIVERCAVCDTILDTYIMKYYRKDRDE